MRSAPVEFRMIDPLDMKISNLQGIFKLRMYTESNVFQGSFQAKNLFFKIHVIIRRNISKINGFSFLKAVN